MGAERQRVVHRELADLTRQRLGRHEGRSAALARAAAARQLRPRRHVASWRTGACPVRRFRAGGGAGGGLASPAGGAAGSGSAPVRGQGAAGRAAGAAGAVAAGGAGRQGVTSLLRRRQSAACPMAVAAGGAGRQGVTLFMWRRVAAGRCCGRSRRQRGMAGWRGGGREVGELVLGPQGVESGAGGGVCGTIAEEQRSFSAPPLRRQHLLGGQTDAQAADSPCLCGVGLIRWWLCARAWRVCACCRQALRAARLRCGSRSWAGRRAADGVACPCC